MFSKRMTDMSIKTMKNGEYQELDELDENRN